MLVIDLITIVIFFFPNSGVGIDQEVAKTFQKILTKQGIKFKLGTKVLGATKSGNTIKVDVEGAKDGKKDSVSLSYK